MFGYNTRVVQVDSIGIGGPPNDLPSRRLTVYDQNGVPKLWTNGDGSLTVNAGAALGVSDPLKTPLFIQGATAQSGPLIDIRDADFNFMAQQLPDGGIWSSHGLSLHGVFPPPAVEPTITGSRAAMGVGTYQVIQALAAMGMVIDGTTV